MFRKQFSPYSKCIFWSIFTFYTSSKLLVEHATERVERVVYGKSPSVVLVTAVDLKASDNHTAGKFIQSLDPEPNIFLDNGGDFTLGTHRADLQHVPGEIHTHTHTHTKEGNSAEYAEQIVF